VEEEEVVEEKVEDEEEKDDDDDMIDRYLAGSKPRWRRGRGGDGAAPLGQQVLSLTPTPTPTLALTLTNSAARLWQQVLRSMAPQWDAQQKSYTLPFYARASLTSVDDLN
jgi:hypothetical protein